MRTHQGHDQIPTVIEFNPAHQITLHVYPDIIGLLGDENRESGTIRSGVSDATMATFKTAPFTIINYLELPPTPPLEDQSPPIFPTNDTTSKENAPDPSLPPSTTSSTEDALNNRSEYSNDN